MGNMNELEMVILDAYRYALRNPHMRFCVYRDPETGDGYLFSDSAGGNSIPAIAWGNDYEKVCEFCFQCWKPEDSDDFYQTNLLNFLSEEERAIAVNMDYEDVKKAFPAAYEAYCNGVIEDEIACFDPYDYL